ncbi:VOC family protein [Leekyejoonella antrihumi]|uniref:VOC family protein n=1 Tax=Leekyejoonella antrihumi TaxID=1660198 RepID=A0A563E3M0_9MICO|nr:VOC family protein [Leekyejoonella antrihumi]TWP36822.1 VOC family protein [Leekyejoonella antrihumi]
MITSVHTLVYSEDPEATRAFLRDVVGWNYTRDEKSAPDWLIFKSGASEVGVHPRMGGEGAARWEQPVHHELSLMCDDIEVTVAELRDRGAEFSGEITDMGFGRGLSMRLPGAGTILVYQPQHAVAYNL